MQFVKDRIEDQSLNKSAGELSDLVLLPIVNQIWSQVVNQVWDQIGDQVGEQLEQELNNENG